MIVGSVSDHGQIRSALEMMFQLFLANFCQMLGVHCLWQTEYLEGLEGVNCYSVFFQ